MDAQNDDHKKTNKHLPRRFPSGSGACLSGGEAVNGLRKFVDFIELESIHLLLIHMIYAE